MPHKMKKKIRTVGTVPTYNRKIVEKGKLDTSNTYMTAHFLALEQTLQ